LANKGFLDAGFLFLETHCNWCFFYLRGKCYTGFNDRYYEPFEIELKKKPPDWVRRLLAYLHDAKKSGIIENIGPGDRSLSYLGGFEVMGASV